MLQSQRGLQSDSAVHRLRLDIAPSRSGALSLSRRRRRAGLANALSAVRAFCARGAGIPQTPAEIGVHDRTTLTAGTEAESA